MHHNFLFDLDQTLLDFHASEKKALEIVLTENGLRYTPDAYAHFKKYNKSLWLELEKGSISREELFRMRFSDLFSFCEDGGQDPARPFPDPLKVNEEFILTMSRNGVPMKGSLEFMDRLKKEIKDARCYIVSNGVTVNAEGRIRSTGLDKYLDGIFISEWMGVNKPAKGFFDIVLEEIKEPGSSCIVIGDSLSSDMLGAKNASLASVWFMPEGDTATAMKAYDIDYCASSFDGLLEVLRKWSAAQ